MPQLSPLWYINLMSWSFAIISFIVWYVQSISFPSLVRLNISRSIFLLANLIALSLNCGVLEEIFIGCVPPVSLGTDIVHVLIIFISIILAAFGIALILKMISQESMMKKLAEQAKVLRRRKATESELFRLLDVVMAKEEFFRVPSLNPAIYVGIHVDDIFAAELNRLNGLWPMSY